MCQKLIAIMIGLLLTTGIDAALHRAAAQVQSPSNEELLNDFGTLVRGLNLSQICHIFSEDLNDELVSYITNVKEALDRRVAKTQQDEVVAAARNGAKVTTCPPETKDEVYKAYFLSQRLTPILYPKGDDPQRTIRFRIKDSYVLWGGAVTVERRCSHLSPDDHAFLIAAYERMATLMPKAWWRPDEIAEFKTMAETKDRRPCGPDTEQSVRSALENARQALK
jgi:hypothetical protein